MHNRPNLLGHDLNHENEILFSRNTIRYSGLQDNEQHSHVLSCVCSPAN